MPRTVLTHLLWNESSFLRSFFQWRSTLIRTEGQIARIAKLDRLYAWLLCLDHCQKGLSQCCKGFGGLRHPLFHIKCHSTTGFNLGPKIWKLSDCFDLFPTYIQWHSVFSCHFSSYCHDLCFRDAEGDETKVTLVNFNSSAIFVYLLNSFLSRLYLR